jgi:hypothetical protein
MEIQLSDLNLTYLLAWYGTCETQEEFDLTTIAEYIESVSMYATDNTTIKEYNPANDTEDFTSLVPGHIYSLIFKQNDFQSSFNIPHLVTTNHLADSTLRVVEFCDPTPTPSPTLYTPSPVVDGGPGGIDDIGGGGGAGSITPTPLGNTVPTPSPVVNHSCCIDENQKHTLDSGVKKITNYDNTSFVSQHDGVICWKELSADMIDGNEVLYYVSFETELDKVDLEVLVQTSQPIYDDVVFEFPNGECYMGNLTNMTPTLNRFTMIQPNDTDGSNGATPTPYYPFDPDLDGGSNSEPTPSPYNPDFGGGANSTPYPTPYMPPVFISPTPTPYNPDLSGGANSTPYPTPYIPPVFTTPTPYNPDQDGIDSTDPEFNLDFDLDSHLLRRQSFSTRVDGMGYIYDIHFDEGSKMGSYSVLVDDTNQVVEVVDVNGNNISTNGFRTMAGTFQYLQDLFEQGVSIISCDYHLEEDYIIYANGDFDGFSIGEIRYNAFTSDNDPQTDDPQTDDPQTDDPQLDGVYSDMDYDEANQEPTDGVIPDADNVDPLGVEIPDTIYDPVVNDFVPLDENGGGDTDNNNSDYLDFEKTPNEESENEYDPIDDIVDNGGVDVDPSEQYEPIENQFIPPMDDPIIDDTMNGGELDVNPTDEFIPPMDDPIIDDTMNGGELDVNPTDEFIPPMDDPIIDDTNENSDGLAFEDITLESLDQSYDLVENQILDTTDSSMELTELRDDDSDENGGNLIFRNI